MKYNITQIFTKQMMCFGMTAAILSAATLLPSEASASTLAVSRGLPEINLNNAAGSNRSNVAWAYGSDYWVGDTFNLATGGAIDELTAWVITSQSKVNFADSFSNMSLYLGSTSGTTIGEVASAGFTGNVSDNGDVSASKTTYVGGADYQGGSGTFYDIWELTFSNLGTYAAGEYMFALAGTGAANYTFVHASNAALDGVPSDDADDLMYVLFGAAGDAVLTLDGSWDSNGDGWDKSSDLNVMVQVSAVPLPAALPLYGTGLGIMGFLGWRKRRKAAITA